jgi:predicted nuclease with RNAse H fold
MNEIGYVGLDPSASARKKSGICILDFKKEIHFIGKWNEFEEIDEILRPVIAKNYLIGIDGPLQLPHELGMCCFSSPTVCNHRQTTSYKGRYCEALLIKKGYRCFMTSQNSFVKSWILRCLSLNKYLQKQSLNTIEVFPFATRRILFPDLTGKKQKTQFRKTLLGNLQRWGVSFPQEDRVYSHDELDAVLAAITALLHGVQQTELIGDERDGFIVIPKIMEKVHLYRNT